MLKTEKSQMHMVHNFKICLTTENSLCTLKFGDPKVSERYLWELFQEEVKMIYKVSASPFYNLNSLQSNFLPSLGK